MASSYHTSDICLIVLPTGASFCKLAPQRDAFFKSLCKAALRASRWGLLWVLHSLSFTVSSLRSRAGLSVKPRAQHKVSTHHASCSEVLSLILFDPHSCPVREALAPSFSRTLKPIEKQAFPRATQLFSSRAGFKPTPSSFASCSCLSVRMLSNHVSYWLVWLFCVYRLVVSTREPIPWGPGPHWAHDGGSCLSPDIFISQLAHLHVVSGLTLCCWNNLKYAVSSSFPHWRANFSTFIYFSDSLRITRTTLEGLELFSMFSLFPGH